MSTKQEASLEERRARGLALLEEMLGKTKAEEIQAGWREICPDFEGYVIEFLSGEIWSRPGLDKRTKSLITIAALMAMGRSKGLELNIRMAAKNCATRADIIETFLHLAPYAGFPAAWDALSIAHAIFSEDPLPDP